MSNWLAVLIKNSDINLSVNRVLPSEKIEIVEGVLSILEEDCPYILDWSTVINFINKLCLLQTESFNRKILEENKAKLAEIANMAKLEEIIITVGNKT